TSLETAGAASSGETVHVPFDDDEGRLRELTKVVAASWPKAGPEPRTAFHSDGLANAVLEWVHGVHVHAIAAHYRRSKRLPAVATMTAAPDFGAWVRERPGFDGLGVAGSWMRFLLERSGAAALRRYVAGVPAGEAFG